MTDAGDFRERLTLLAPVDLPDGQGGVTRSYAAAGKVWARVVQIGGSESVSADADGATIQLRIEARAPLVLSLAHRLQHDAKTYAITVYRDDGRIVTIDATLRVS